MEYDSANIKIMSDNEFDKVWNSKYTKEELKKINNKFDSVFVNKDS